MKFVTLKELIDRINHDLGNFCSEFAYTRKNLAQLDRSSNRHILFKYENEARDWSINEGGGTEIQYHIYFRDDEVGYGLGFNTQFVKFAGDKWKAIYMKKFTDAFLTLYTSQKQVWNEQGFKWIYGSEDELKNIRDDQYYLFGKCIPVVDSAIEDEAYNKLLNDIKGVMFSIYKDVFRMKNAEDKNQYEKKKDM